MSTTGTRRRRLGTILISAALAVSLSACSGLIPNGSLDRGSAAAGKKLTAEDVAKAGSVTIRFSDIEGNSGPGQAIVANIATFEKKFPNIKVIRDTQTQQDYEKTIDLRLSSKDAPDIAQANVVMARRLVPANLIRPLDSYAKAYGWEDRYPASVLGLLKISKNGKQFGDGEFYGQSLGGNMVGVYYNAGKLKSLGIGVPKTFDEFEAALEAAKNAGELPIQMGNLDLFQAGFALGTIVNEFQDPQPVRDWVSGVPKSTFELQGVKAAMAKMQDWVKKGYISSQANGTLDNDASAAFAKGEGVFDITGTWRQPLFDEALGENGGFMTLPRNSDTGGALAEGWLQNPFTISAKSKHADIAAYLLDYLSGPESEATNLAGGYLPFSDDAKATGGPIAQDILKAWYASRDKGLTPYLDFATPSMGDTLFPALQTLIGLKQTPDQVTQTIQQNWNEYYSAGS